MLSNRIWSERAERVVAYRNLHLSRTSSALGWHGLYEVWFSPSLGSPHTIYLFKPPHYDLYEVVVGMQEEVAATPRLYMSGSDIPV